MQLSEPTADIYDFRGSIEYAYDGDQTANSEFDNEDLGNSQFIPRGSTVKFSGKVYALVVYTGDETKLMQNLGTSRSKLSFMQLRIIYGLTFNFFAFALFVFVSALVNGLLTKSM